MLEELFVNKTDLFPFRTIFLVLGCKEGSVETSRCVYFLYHLRSSFFQAIFFRQVSDENLSTTVFPLSVLLCEYSLTGGWWRTHPRIKSRRLLALFERLCTHRNDISRGAPLARLCIPYVYTVEAIGNRFAAAAATAATAACVPHDNFINSSPGLLAWSVRSLSSTKDTNR